MPFYPIRSGETTVQPYRVIASRASGARAITRESDGTLWVGFTSKIHYGVGDREQITIAYSTDEGVTWTNELIFEDSDTASSFVRILIDSNDTLHLIAQRRYITAGVEYDVYTYKPKGGVWQTLVNTLAYAPGTGRGSWTDIALDSNDNIHKVSTSIAGPSLLLYEYKPYGGSWVAGIIIDTTPASWALKYANTCVGDDDTLHIAYSKQTGVNIWEIFYVNRIAGVWGAITQVTTYGVVAEQSPLGIAIKDGVVYVGYDYETGLGAHSFRCQRRSAAGVWTYDGGITGQPWMGNIVLCLDDVIRFNRFRRSGGAGGYYQETMRVAAGNWVLGPAGDFYGAFVTHDSLALSSLWANWPKVDGISTNIPYSGFCCVVGRDVPLDVAFYIPPSGMVFPPSVTTNKAYALSREEL